MTRDEAIRSLEGYFGEAQIRRRTLQNGDVMVAIGPLAVPGRDGVTTRVGLRLPPEVESQPLVFIDNLALLLPGGGLPNNHREELVEGESWRAWSMQQLWAPSRTPYQLVLMVIERWSRDS